MTDQYYDGFQDGEQSKQQEVDKLQSEVDSLRIELNGANERASMILNHKNKMVDKLQTEVDELRKRIDEALRELIVYENISVARKILEGEQND